MDLSCLSHGSRRGVGEHARTQSAVVCMPYHVMNDIHSNCNINEATNHLGLGSVRVPMPGPLPVWTRGGGQRTTRFSSGGLCPMPCQCTIASHLLLAAGDSGVPQKGLPRPRNCTDPFTFQRSCLPLHPVGGVLCGGRPAESGVRWGKLMESRWSTMEQTDCQRQPAP